MGRLLLGVSLRGARVPGIVQEEFWGRVPAVRGLRGARELFDLLHGGCVISRWGRCRWGGGELLYPLRFRFWLRGLFLRCRAGVVQQRLEGSASSL